MIDFKELLNWHVKLDISGLNNVDDREDVAIAGFNRKEYIEELVLDWELKAERNTDLDEEVLDAIEAHKNLKRLSIQNYGGKRLTDWIVGVAPSYTDLVSLSIDNCFNCEALPSLGSLPFLKDLSMEGLECLEMLGAEFYGDEDDCRDEVLEELNIESSLSELVSADVNRFTSLKRLDLKIPHCGGDEDGGAVRLPPNLSELKIDCVTLNVPTNILTHLSTLSCLTYLDLFCRLAETFPDVKLPCTLEFLTIAYCNDLRTTPDRFLSDCSKSLQKLVIFKCRNLVSLPSNLSTLKSLHTLRIHECSIRLFPAATGSGLHYLDNLSYLSIFCCPELESLPGAFHATATLQTLLLRQCPNLRVAGDGLPTNLRKLEISECGKMKPVVKTMLSTLASLTELHLQGFLDISSLDRCLPESIRTLTICTFPRLRSLSGVLPTLKNLRRLQVDDCPLVNQKSWS